MKKKKDLRQKGAGLFFVLSHKSIYKSFLTLNKTTPQLLNKRQIRLSFY